MAATTSNDEKLILPVNEKPTFWNQNIFKGAFLGSLLLSIAGAALGALGLISAPAETVQFLKDGLTSDALATVGSSLQAIAGGIVGMIAGNGIGTLAGAVYGGVRGKQQMQRDLEKGKEISPPTFWNKSIFTGLFIGVAVGTALEIALSAVGIVSGQSSNEFLGTAGQIIGNIAPIWGAIRGGFVGKETMQQEYSQALAIREQERGLGISRVPGSGLSYAQQPQQSTGIANPYKNSVSMEEAQILETRSKNSGTGKTDFAAQLEAARNQPKLELSKA